MIDPRRSAFTLRSVLAGLLLCSLIGVGAPYANMVIRGSTLFYDFSTAGALFLFFILVGVANVLFKVALPFLALGRRELIVVYIMMIVASAIPTMGLTEYLLPIISGAHYYATPENEWVTLIHPYVREWMVPQSAQAVKWFYEGAPRGMGVPWAVWARPLCWWGILLLALYLVMVSFMVIIRRQWMERERLIYPIVQVPIELVREGDAPSLLPPFFRDPVMWAGFLIPAVVSSLNALHTYFNFIPAVSLTTSIPIFRNTVNLDFRLSFPMLGFSYLINLDIAFSLWFFNWVAKAIRGSLNILGIASTEKLGIYGVSTEPILAHQGQGAIFVLVLFGLWLGRRHLADVFRKAFRGDASVDDSREIMSYRGAVFTFLVGLVVMVGWLWLSGLPLWAAAATLILAILIFIGLTRVVVECGVATAVGPMIASSVLVSGTGSALLGPVGMVGMAYTYVWCADIRTFVMASCAHGLKLAEDLGSNRRPLFWLILLAVVASVVGSVWSVLVICYEYGGINLSGWFFGGGVRAPFEYVAVKLNAPTLPNWEGWIHTLVGGGVMAALMLARHHLLWWPLHPTGYPIGAVWLMDRLWLSIFMAWLLKVLVMKYGGPVLYRRIRPFFLGLIFGQFVISGVWLLIDYLTGMTDNQVFWI
ncbi:MAG TPA: hypothetical protein EYM39_12100 [Candidatus Latescibacteria bacterium]|nr:hypothetical protein [Candidatus Latescibacterota bacterium]